MKAWHFLQDNGRLWWGPSGEMPGPKVKVGQTLTVKPPLIMCAHGLHASLNVFDALGYAPGALICRVELSGEIIKDPDKVVASERTILWMVDATNALFEFSCWCAERALKQANVTDERSWAAIHTRRAWLRGDATDADLDAARAAARAAEEKAQKRKLTKSINRLKP